MSKRDKAAPAPASVPQYLEDAINAAIKDRPDTDHQLGYLSAIVEMGKVYGTVDPATLALGKTLLEQYSHG